MSNTRILLASPVVQGGRKIPPHLGPKSPEVPKLRALKSTGEGFDLDSRFEQRSMVVPTLIVDVTSVEDSHISRYKADLIHLLPSFKS